MSIKRLTDNEWATYQIGAAILRHLDEGPRDRATVEHIEAVFGWLEHWMTDRDIDVISLITGYLINGPFENGHVPRFTDPLMPRDKKAADLFSSPEASRPERPSEPPSRPVRRRKPDLH
jgi:hypothetical protein